MSLFDHNGNEIQRGDLILYGHNFSVPIVGYVTVVYSNSFRYEYMFGETLHRSTCKLPERCMIVNDLKDSTVFRTMFSIDALLSDRSVEEEPRKEQVSSEPLELEIQRLQATIKRQEQLISKLERSKEWTPTIGLT